MHASWRSNSVTRFWKQLASIIIVVKESHVKQVLSIVRVFQILSDDAHSVFLGHPAFCCSPSVFTV